MPLDLRIDFSDVKDLVAFPADTYPATVGGFEVKQTKDKSSTYVAVKFQIDVNGTNRILTKNFSLKPEHLWSFKQFLVRAGYPADELAGQAEIDETKVQGNAVLVSVTVDEYQGEDRNNIDKVFAADSSKVSEPAAAGGSKKSKAW